VRSRAGFTLIELTVVVAIAGVVLAMGALSLSDFFRRSSARRAAQVFAQDLVTARDYAVRVREPVVLRVYEGTLSYDVVSQDGFTEVLRRRFAGSSADFELSELELDMSGDTLVFSSRGRINMSGADGALGIAAFSAGEITYEVRFNSLGASKVDES